MLIVVPGDSDGNFCPNRSATRAICSPLSSTEHSPTPCTPRVWFRSVVYSSIVNATIGFCSMCRALSVVLLDQKYNEGPSLTYRNVAACGTPVGDAVARLSVLCSPRYSRTGP